MQYYCKKIELNNEYEQIYICSSNFDQEGYIIADKAFGVVFTAKDEIKDIFNINFPVKLKEEEFELIDKDTFEKIYEFSWDVKGLDKGYIQHLNHYNKKLLKQIEELKGEIESIKSALKKNAKKT
ncbi:hypothetical protein [Capnocytophaga sp. oral taxon 878]|uniref:hypothetical protein n=1 Tax=Capnocytophaga sp. oral taxon 878 TaxID=1316596 RepID=UPI000D0379EE|nr:hypothetical protein [Capnocytophaga sp. oral taxon 878]AVM51554.1 hypothetical protein C4H12_13630 [Capnocytophaga sp. oral taxon 878]